MTRPAAFAAVLAVMLAGCHKEPPKPKAVDEVVAQAGKLVKPRPGRYETSADLINFSVPGLPPKQAEQIKSMMGNVAGQSGNYCLSADEADKGFEESIRKMTEGNAQMKCDFQKFDADETKFTAALTCQGPRGLSADIALDGTTSAEQSQMHMNMTQKASMIPGGEMQVELKMTSHRVGDC